MTDNVAPLNTTSTTNSVGNKTGQAQAQNTDSSSSLSQAPVTATQALALVSDVYSSQTKNDPNLHIAIDHTQTDGNHSVFVIHVFDDIGGHTSTIAWVWVRDDGLLENGLLQSGWVTPEAFSKQVADESSQSGNGSGGVSKQSGYPQVNANSDIIGKTINQVHQMLQKGKIGSASTILVKSTTGIAAFGGKIPGFTVRQTDQVYALTNTAGGVDMTYLIYRHAKCVASMTTVASTASNTVQNVLSSQLTAVSPAISHYGKYELLKWQGQNAIFEAVTVPTGKGDYLYYPIEEFIQFSPIG